MFFEDIVIIYDSNIFEYSQLFESFRLEHEMLDATSNVNVFEYSWLRQVCSNFRESHPMNTYSYVTFFTAKVVLCRQERVLCL